MLPLIKVQSHNQIQHSYVACENHCEKRETKQTTAASFAIFSSFPLSLSVLTTNVQTR